MLLLIYTEVILLAFDKDVQVKYLGDLLSRREWVDILSLDALNS